jgi:hypothetical protein
MIIVAGPPGGGNSSRFTVGSVGGGWFNADDRAAQLNAGRYRKIPQHIRESTGRELKEFIDSRIEARTSFAFENDTIGGHSASENLLRGIYKKSLKNLALAFMENRHGRTDLLRISDNSAPEVPAWLTEALATSDFNVVALQAAMHRRGLKG